MVIVANPRTFKIPDWFLNRQKDHKDGRNSQLTSSALDTKLRDDLERLKKIRCAAEAAAQCTQLTHTFPVPALLPSAPLPLKRGSTGMIRVLLSCFTRCWRHG